MLGRILHRFNQWAERSLRLTGETDESFYAKKVYLISTWALSIVLVFMTLICWWLQLYSIMPYAPVWIAIFLIQTPILLWQRRGLKWFLFVGNTLHNLITFWLIFLLGGITHSGGLIFVGLASAVYCMLLPNRWLLWYGLSFYMLTIIVLAILEPHLTPNPEMTLERNLILFIVNTFFMSGCILILVFFFYRKRAELDRLKVTRLQEMDDLKSRMFANIAHEFRTPLTLIEGMAELLRDHPHHDVHDRTEMILRNANKVLRLVDQMLNLARIEAGSMPIHYVQGDVTAFLSYVCNSFTGLAEHRNVRLHFLPDSQKVVMDFDPEKLEEVVGNLLSNALKYTPAGGNVYLNFYIEKNPAEQFVLKVKDTGIGIPAEKLNYIFDRFYRVESEQKRYEEGSGIGLTLVREYVKLMKGEITVESQSGQGTQFTISLPVTRNAIFHEEVYSDTKIPLEESEVLDWVDPVDGHTHQPHLLIIEDNTEVIQYLQLVLKDQYELLCANNGEEGIRQALEHIPDLILSDVMMPGKDGYEVCRTLKKDFRTSHIPIVLLTARADTTSRITGLEQGADAYLTKPFNKKELLVCLRNLFYLREKLRIKFSSPASNHELENGAGPDGLFMNSIHRILEQHYTEEDFSIEALYSAMDISRVQLHRKLIALTGLSASRYIRNFRLEKAKELLRTTKKSVSEIAYETGFNDANYFSRVFALEYGVPPSGLRKTADHEV